MTILFELDEVEWQKWVDSRPIAVKVIAQRLPPNRLYRMKTTQQRVTLYSISEDGTVTVEITGEYNLIDFDRRVFGVDPDNLEECDLPASDEPVGTLCTTEDEVNAAIEPQLAEMHREGRTHNIERCPLCRTKQ